MLEAPECGALKSMYWRSEILQVMYWLRGEGFGDEVDARVIERFLGVDAETGVQYLDLLVEEGFVSHVDEDRYRLSEEGRREGGLEFASSFEDLMRPSHGECGPDCPHCFPPEGETDCTEGCPVYEMTQSGASAGSGA
ncbi:MAG: hypothetical protein ACRD0Q_09245 [Acidimicrobiales bacterium]